MEPLRERLTALTDALKRGRLDVPDGLLDRNAAFSLNGTPYETLLGRDPDDPLIRLIARGPAGYRFAAQALIRALGTPDLAIDRFDDAAPGYELTATLSGTLRGTTDAVRCPVILRLTTTLTGAIASADVVMEPAVLTRLDAARSLP
ncbi:MAG: hypothetical protein AB7I25_09895 [Vicinamibacterales bacterium]